MAKVKERILKAAREKQRVTYKTTAVRLSADFPADILQSRREQHVIFKVLKEKKILQPRILYLARLSLRTEGEKKNFSDKQNIKDFINTKLTLKRNVRGSSLCGKEKLQGVKIYRKGKKSLVNTNM